MEDQSQAPPGPAAWPGAYGRAHHDVVSDPGQIVAVHAGAAPLPLRVEVRQLDHAAQVAAEVGVTAGHAVPVVSPEHPVIFRAVAVPGRDALAKPCHLLAAIQSREPQRVTAD